MRRFLLVPVLIALCSFTGQAQQKEQTDSLVRLLSATRMEQVDRNGQNYRKVVGPARFLHNNTFLICDTAFWNMNTSIIECINNVSIVQEGTKLTSDKLIYLVDEDLARSASWGSRRALRGPRTSRSTAPIRCSTRSARATPETESRVA